MSNYNKEQQEYYQQLDKSSSQDDIQDIIMQAQKAFAKQDTKRTNNSKSDGLRTNEQSQEDNNSEGIQHKYPTNYTVMPKNEPIYSLGGSQGQCLTMQNVDIAKVMGSKHTTNSESIDNDKATDKEATKKSRNVMLSSNQNSEYMYVDTNQENDQEEEERTYTPEPARMSQSPLNYKKIEEASRQPNIIQGTKSTPNLPMNPHHVTSMDRMTGHFNSKYRNVQEDDSNNHDTNNSYIENLRQANSRTPDLENYYQMAQSNIERNASQALKGRSSVSPINQYRKRMWEKSTGKTDDKSQKSHSQGPVLNRDTSQSQDRVSGRVERASLKSMNSNTSATQTKFSKHLGKLYDKITEIYPSFQKIASSKSIHPQLMPEDLLRAENVYNQLNYMYTRAVQNEKNTEEIEDKALTQLEHQNNTLNFQLENSAREISYYTKQVDVFKNQLSTAAMREQQTEVNYEKRLQFLNDQVKKYEGRVDQMQLRLDVYEKDKEDAHQLSFREDNRRASRSPFKSPTHNINVQENQYEHTDRKTFMEYEPKIRQLDFEVKDLKSKLKHKEELIGFEKEGQHNLQSKIDRINDAFKAELQTYAKENSHLKEQMVYKDSTIVQLQSQVENFIHTATLEFPILLPQVKQATVQNLSQSVNLTNQNAKNKQFISMKGEKKKKQGILQELDVDLDEIMNKTPFGIDDDEIPLNMNKKSYRAGLSGTRGKSPNINRKQNSQGAGKNSVIESMFSITDSMKQQMTALLVTDDILQDLKEVKKEKIQKVEAQLQDTDVFVEKLDLMKEEKDEMSLKLKTLTKDNEQLKHKFSQLLDQFQEYVNESERKIEEDQEKQKEQQQNLLNELNNTISQLEEMSKGLQDDVREKQNEINQINQHKKNLQEELDDVQRESQEIKNLDDIQKVKIKSLNEELNYAKQQYMMEVEALRGENVNLHGRMREKSSEIMKNRRFNHQRAPSPYDINEDLVTAQASMHNGLNPQAEESFEKNGQDLGLMCESRMSRQKSNTQMMMSDPYNHGKQSMVSTNQDLRGSQYSRFRDPDTDLQDVLYGEQMKNIRSKSYDRALGPGSRNQNQNPNISSTSNERHANYEEKKRDMLDKDRLIEQKNREIVKLRMENDELRANDEDDHDQTRNKKQQRTKVMAEIEEILENIRVELEKTKINLFKNEGQGHPSVNYNRKITEVIQTEENLLSVLVEKTQGMRNLTSLASEVYLLSNKGNRYSPTPHSHKFNASPTHTNYSQNDQQEVQKLMLENGNLQRALKQYEQTINQIENGQTNPDDPQNMFELQRTIQQQLQQIMQLQQDNDIMNQQLSDNQDQGFGNNRQIHKFQQESRVLKQEVQMLRECEQRAQNLKNGNDELMSERRQLISKIESLEDGNMQVNDMQLQLNDRDAQLEELRTRITGIAELFEKKGIKQRYSFEVLCDFIHDKAKRLFNKYENVVKDKKSLQADDKGSRKIYKLESDISNMQEGIALLKSYIMPNIMSLINQDDHQDEVNNLNIPFMKKMVGDLEFEFKRQRKEIIEGNQTIQNNLDHISQLQNKLDNKPMDTGRLSPYSASRAPQVNQTDQIEAMKIEKDQLNHKLDDFGQILREFQNNQRQFENENNMLKVKINQMESSQTAGLESKSQRNIGKMLLNSMSGNENTMSVSMGGGQYSANQRKDNFQLTQQTNGTHGMGVTSHSNQTSNYIGGVAIHNDRVAASPMKQM